MCDICERIETAKRHRDWAIECCLQHGDLLEAQNKDQGYRSYLNYLYSLKGNRGCVTKGQKIAKKNLYVTYENIKACLVKSQIY
jgi:hypothetical protein